MRAARGVFRGAHHRAVGTHLVTAGDVHPLASDVSRAESIATSFSTSARTDTLLSMAGDVDGDGSCDIVTGHPGGLNPDITTAEVYVIPSTPNTPD